MSSSSAYTVQLPYLGSIPLGKSPPNLASFQKPLRELYILFHRQRRERHPDERRIIISDRDILIFEPDAASKGKRALIYSTLEAIVDIQALELYMMFNHTEHHKRVRAAFLPIGCEQQERFRSLYSTIDKSQYNLLSPSTSALSSSSSSSPSSSCHPPLVLFVMRKTGAGGTCSLLDCHVFAVRRESIAFELCDMIRKLIIKRTMSPIVPNSTTTTTTATATGTTLLRIHDTEKETTIEKRTKYLDRDRPISAMEHRQADIQTVTDRKNDWSGSNLNLNDVPHCPTNGASNLLSSSSSLMMNGAPHNQSFQENSKVLAMESELPSIRTLTTKHHHHHNHHQQPPQQRHFIKASSSTSSLVVDESDEVVNDLMNIVVAERLKTIDTNISQAPVKRHASFDQTPLSNGHPDYSMNKKRYQFHHHHHQHHHQNSKKRSMIMNSRPLPTIMSANNTPVISRTGTNVEQPPAPTSILDTHLLRPQLILNRYGDIGNYVPKLLRDSTSTATTSTTMRSSDSNENIFFRATNGHILNGFLNLDFTSAPPTQPNSNSNNNNNNNSNLCRSSPCLNDDNQERNAISLVRQLKKNSTKPHVAETEASPHPHQPVDVEVEPQESDHRVPTCRIPRVTLPTPMSKPMGAVIGGIKVLPFIQPLAQPNQRASKPAASAKPKRVASFTIADTELPVDYRQYLRHTDQGDYLYGEEQQRQQQQSTLEHSLGYFP